MTVNIGIIGTGRIAENQLAPALRQVKGARLRSVLSRDAARAKSFATEHASDQGDAMPVGHASLQEFLADPDLHAVIIATPDALHAEQAIAAARAGKHVLLEKPMATSSADAAAINAACEAAEVRLGIAYHLHWHDGHRKLAAMLHGGELGRPRYARALWAWQTQDNSNWRAHADLGRWWGLSGVGTHCLDMLRWMLLPVCGEVAKQSSLIDSSTFGGPHDETACVSLQFGDGTLAELTTSVMFTAPPRFELYTSDAAVICDGTLSASGASDGTITINGEPLAFAEANPYAGEIQNFVDAINGEAAIEVSGAEGQRNVEILLQALPGV